MPVLIAVGTTDDIAGSAHELQQVIAGSEVLDIPNRDHMRAVGDRVGLLTAVAEAVPELLQLLQTHGRIAVEGEEVGVGDHVGGQTVLCDHARHGQSAAGEGQARARVDEAVEEADTGRHSSGFHFIHE